MNDDPDSVVAQAREAGAMGLKLYAQLDSVGIRRLTAAAHRAGMPVWGHAWVQPASVRRAGQARAWTAWSTPPAWRASCSRAEDRDTLVNDGDAAGRHRATWPRPKRRTTRASSRRLDSMAAHGTMFEPTLDATRHSVATYDSQVRHVPSLQEDYVRAAAGFGMEVTREAVQPRGADQRRQRPRGLRAGAAIARPCSASCAC